MYLFVSCFIIHSWNVDSAVLCLVTQLCLTLGDLVDSSPPGSSVHGDSPGKNIGEGCHALLHSGDEALAKEMYVELDMALSRESW